MPTDYIESMVYQQHLREMVLRNERRRLAVERQGVSPTRNADGAVRRLVGRLRGRGGVRPGRVEARG